VLTQGYDAERGTFTQAYGYKGLDAAVLALPLRRLIDANDPMMVSTIERVRAELGVPGADHLLHRVSPSFDDGLEGKEGAFLLCSFWLVDCYSAMGRLEEAQALLERLMSYANDVGLLAEMINPATGGHLGNFPQALTHVALINAAAHLEEARRRPLRPA
jgi:GH15 family glucan-1,4-alpha-glucosidase